MTARLKRNATPELRLDHLAYLRERPYRRSKRLELRRLTRKAGVSDVLIEHEADDSCCALEPWPLTYARLIQQLRADGLPVTGGVAPGLAEFFIVDREGEA